MSEPKDPPPPPTPIWSKLPERFAEALAQATKDPAIVAASDPSVDIYRFVESLARLEYYALECARTAMREEGLIATVPSGTKIWFQVAQMCSDYMRTRIGLPAGEPFRPS